MQVTQTYKYIDVESNDRDGPTGHKNNYDSGVLSYYERYYKVLKSKVSVSALYYLPILIYTYTNIGTTLILLYVQLYMYMYIHTY